MDAPACIDMLKTLQSLLDRLQPAPTAAAKLRAREAVGGGDTAA